LQVAVVVEVVVQETLFLLEGAAQVGIEHLLELPVVAHPQNQNLELHLELHTQSQ
jgi:hypothetical protein